MIVNLDEIKELLLNGNLSEVARETGLKYRTLQSYKLKENKWLADTIDKLEKLQTYINVEELKMKNIANQEKLAFLNHLAEVAADPNNRLSNEIDDKIWRNKQDVVALYERIENGEAFVFTGEEYREYLDELIADNEEEKESFEEKWEEFLESNSNLVIEEYGEASFV